MALNVDGLERKRKKWNRSGARLVPAFRVAVNILSNGNGDGCSADSGLLSGRVWQGFRVYSVWRGGGEGEGDARRYWQLGLEPGGGYFLYVSRLEPENNALLVREAFERVNTPLKLALIGDAPYAEEYIRADSRTRRMGGW